MFLVQVGRYQRWNFPSEESFYRCVRDRSDGIFKGPKEYEATLLVDKHPMILEDNKYVTEQWKKIRAGRLKAESLVQSAGTTSGSTQSPAAPGDSAPSARSES